MKGESYKGGMLKSSVAFKPCGVNVLSVCMNLCSQIARFLGLHAFKIINEYVFSESERSFTSLF